MDTLASPPIIDPATGRPAQSSGAFIAGTQDVGYFPQSHRGVARSNQYIPKVGVSYNTEDDRSSLGSFYRQGWRGQSQSSGSQSRFTFSELAPRREDTQHGYVGEGGAEFSMDNRGAFGNQSGRFINTVEAPSDEGQYNTGGRPIGYSGAEAIAEEGGDEEGEEAEGLAQTASSDSGVPGMRSVRDPTTGQYDIGIQKAEAPPTAPPAPARSAKPYTTADVPRDRGKLIAFITMLEKKHPGYNQAVYKTSNDKSVRINTIRKMTDAGLL
jgi:hypothetical protein